MSRVAGLTVATPSHFASSRAVRVRHHRRFSVRFESNLVVDSVRRLPRRPGTVVRTGSWTRAPRRVRAPGEEGARGRQEAAPLRRLELKAIGRAGRATHCRRRGDASSPF
jgi:hypothetical protein